MVGVAGQCGVQVVEVDDGSLGLVLRVAHSGRYVLGQLAQLPREGRVFVSGVLLQTINSLKTFSYR